MIVSDSSTLIILFDLGKIDYLSNIFKKVYILQKVFKEISHKKKIDLPSFIEVVTIQDIEELEIIKMLLDDGESEAILLANELNKPLLIDEKKGRKIAKNRGIKIIGLLGVLLLNYKKDYLKKDEILLFLKDALSHGYRISEKLLNKFTKELECY